MFPQGSGRDFWQHPVGTGPFRFVSQQIDQDVVVERNPLSWSVVPKIERVRFAVVPDAITRIAGTGKRLRRRGRQFPAHGFAAGARRAAPICRWKTRRNADSVPGFNLRDPLLKDVRVRQAIACAIDRGLIIHTLLRGHAQPAVSLLPASHWAYTGDVARYDYDPARAARLLDESWHKRGRRWRSASI